ncbi:translation elongation factor-like protein [Candidatus Pacearchaeota archaeon]|nr:translation elongation factor-like protein [Candidatus Pacearchaeota archaeon]
MDEGSEAVEGREVGAIFDYFSKVGVAALNLTGSLKVGDKIRIKGTTTDFEQTVDSIQMHKKPMQEAKAGDEIGIKVNDKVRRHDKVYVV